MKLYCKIKRDGKWNWFPADSPWKQHVARSLCECRVCRPGKPEIVSSKDIDKQDATCSVVSVADLLSAEESNSSGVE